MLVTVNNRRARGVRQRTIKQPVNFGPIALRFVTIAILALLTLIYLIQSTKGSTKQMQVTNLEDKKDALMSEKQDIEVETIRLKALNQLKNASEALKLEPVTDSENLSGGKP